MPSMDTSSTSRSSATSTGGVPAVESWVALLASVSAAPGAEGSARWGPLGVVVDMAADLHDEPAGRLGLAGKSMVSIYSTGCQNKRDAFRLCGRPRLGPGPGPPHGGERAGDIGAGGNTRPPPVDLAEQVARAALELFARRGYDGTTVEDIAAAVGVSRRTFFRYYESKRDVVWGEFDAELARLEACLAAPAAGEPMMDVLRRAVMATNRFGAGELDELRIRIGLIATVPTLTAHSAVRYAEWCQVVARFAARRLGTAAGDLGPQTVARAALGAATAAFACWAQSGSDDLADDLDRAFRMLAAGFEEACLAP